MSDKYFREILGLKPNATKDEVRQAYHRLAKENHPDLFPQEKKALQELKMMALNEAYTCLVSLPEKPIFLKESKESKTTINKKDTVFPQKEVGFHKDPSYVYYKQGFIHFSQAVHGIAELNQKSVRRELRYKSDKHFVYSLKLLRIAHGYFLRVLQDYPDSIWRADAEIKLKRIERFSMLYRKIMINIRGSKPWT